MTSMSTPANMVATYTGNEAVFELLKAGTPREVAKAWLFNRKVVMTIL